MVQIIERKFKAKVSEIDREKYPNFQVSLTNEGRIVLRFYNKQNPNEDIIISLTLSESTTLKQFIKWNVK